MESEAIIPDQKSVALFAELMLRTAAIFLTLAALARPTHAAQISVPRADVSSSIQSSSVQANSNCIPAGTIENGGLTLRLELREGEWHPEADLGPSLRVYSFAEEGKSPQVPGPLIRVAAGVKMNRNHPRALRWRAGSQTRQIGCGGDGLRHS